jgi:hypothetical protein
MSVDDESDSITDEESLFDKSVNKIDVTTDDDIGSLLGDSDNDTDDESLFNDEERHPPEYYLSGVANLNVKRLRQKRYRLKT